MASDLAASHARRDRKPFHPISKHAGREWMPWAYCLNEPACGHNARVDIAAVIARTGDMPADEFRRRLECPLCGSRARLVIGWRG
jgi:hypothetical protein